MIANSNELERLILVADDELSSFKGISRLSESLCSDIDHVSSSFALMQWLDENQSRLKNSKKAFCLVFDPKVVEITLDGAINEFLAGFPRICISRSSDVATTLRSIRTGAFDFIEKPFSLSQIHDILERAFSLHEFGVAIKEQFHSLTKREIETCELVVLGHSNKEISEKMAISIKTVKVHRANLMRKTHAKSVTDLLRLHDRFSSIKRSETLQPNGLLVHGGLEFKPGTMNGI
jgi:FixJ family two-component response regulator